MVGVECDGSNKILVSGGYDGRIKVPSSQPIPASPYFCMTCFGLPASDCIRALATARTTGRRALRPADRILHTTFRLLLFAVAPCGFVRSLLRLNGNDCDGSTNVLVSTAVREGCPLQSHWLVSFALSKNDHLMPTFAQLAREKWAMPFFPSRPTPLAQKFHLSLTYSLANETLGLFTPCATPDQV